MSQNTTIHLLNVPLESDYRHTYHFSSKDEQYNFFLSKKVKSLTNSSYQRRDSHIRFPANIEDLRICNYVMFQNLDFSDKWYYAFIKEMKYSNSDMTEIYIDIDVMQTWFFDYEVKSSFVEREHVKDDTIGANTVPEQLETGEYIVNSVNKEQSLLITGAIIGTTIDLSQDINKTEDNHSGGAEYNGVYSGVKYYSVPNKEYANTLLSKLANNGKSDAVVSLFMAPALYIYVDATKTYFPVTQESTVTTKKWSSGNADQQIYKPSSINGYTPKNKKLLTYPYNYLLMSNNAGGGAIYKYEMFKNPDNSSLCSFNINFALTPGCSIRLIPQNYNGASSNNEEGLNLGKYPICSWANDTYINWLTQNSINLGVQAVTSVGTIAAGIGMIATGGGALAGAGMITSGLTSIASTVGEVYQHKLQPPQAEGNLNSGDVTFSQKDLTFTAYQMSIKSEYARIIDEFFSMFGYKVNRVKVPNKNHRSHYWYIKTIDINIDGAIPNEDMKIIKENYDKGITFWRSSSTITDYSVNNTIL